MSYAFWGDFLLIRFVLVCCSDFCLIASLHLACEICVFQPFFISLFSARLCHKLYGLFTTMTQFQVSADAQALASTDTVISHFPYFLFCLVWTVLSSAVSSITVSSLYNKPAPHAGCLSVSKCVCLLAAFDWPRLQIFVSPSLQILQSSS